MIRLLCFLFCIALFAKANPNQTISTHADNPNQTPPTSTTESNLKSKDLAPLQENLSQENLVYLKYNLGFDFYLDNTEGSEGYWATRTLYAIRLSPEIGLGIGKNHSLMFGGYVIQNMGATTFPTKANISAYYRYEIPNFRANLGIFSRKYWIGEYPLSFFRQDFLFFNPNTNGILLQYISNPESKINGYAEFVFDWYGGNLQKRNDEFFILFSGRMNFLKYAFLGANVLVYHFKNDEILGVDNEGTYLMDKIYYNVFVGVDLKPFFKMMDKAQIQFGTLSSLERKRKTSGLDPFYNGLGWEASIKAQYKGFGIEESYYFGKSQMRYFNPYGEDFYDGLPFYQANNFNRINLYYEYKTTWLKTNISFMFYSLPNNTLALQQMLTLSIDTQNLFSKARHFRLMNL